MSKEEKDKKKESNNIDFTKIAVTTLKHWPWLLLSIVVWMALAFVYLKVKQPRYLRSAKILLKDENPGSSLSAQLGAFAGMGVGMGMFGSGTTLMDEIIKMESPDLMEKVVKRLDLDMIFERPGDYHREPVYGDSLPVRLIAPTWTDDDFIKMQIDIARNGDIRLSHLQHNADKLVFEQKAPGRLGHPIQTPVGFVTINSTPAFRKGEEYTLYLTRLPIPDAVYSYGKATEIIREDELANVILISVIDKSGDRARDIIQTILDVYNENWASTKNAETYATDKFIDERLAAIEKELGAVDQDISEFQSKNQLPDLEKAAAVYLADNQMADQHLLELTNQVKVARYMRNYMESAAHSNEVLPTFTTLGVGTSALERQISEYNEKLMERNRLASNSSASHPMIVTLDEQLDQMRSAILNSTSNEVASLNAQIENVLAKKGNVQSQITKAPMQATTLRESGRQQKVLENLYLYLLQKREENQLNQVYGIYNNEIIARPNGDKKPARPRRPLIYAVAFFMGLFTPFSFFSLKEIRRTLKTSKKED